MNSSEFIETTLKQKTAFLVIALAMALSSDAKGDLAFTFNNPTFVAGSGVRMIEVLVNSDNSDQVTAVSFDALLIDGGIFAMATGAFDGIGMSVLDTPVVFRDGMNSQLAYADTGFDLPGVTFPAISERLATLNVDITGLLPGDYAIEFTNLSALTDVDISVLGTNGFFTITAVPEPSSLVGAVVLGLLGCYRWRRKKVRDKNDS